ncbi:hypothetical protein CJ030_MR2G006059 [Morella rubra]|uniref:Uncharacterized protein n=1 Tax=Morella rubra TaxID=262757 RepID=A0A6A1WFE2_9ROSI|nr:hypothetical protein CJ030_MR2G006059 [Morella rubra]
MKYIGRSICDLMDDQGWIGHLKRDGVASVDLVWEFYVALLDVADLDALVWTTTVCRVTFQLLADILAAFMGMQSPIGAYPAVEMGTSQMRRHLPYIHGPGRGCRWTLHETEVHASILAYSAPHLCLRHPAEGSHDRVFYSERRADVIRG